MVVLNKAMRYSVLHKLRPLVSLFEETSLILEGLNLNKNDLWDLQAGELERHFKSSYSQIVQYLNTQSQSKCLSLSENRPRVEILVLYRLFSPLQW